MRHRPISSLRWGAPIRLLSSGGSTTTEQERAPVIAPCSPVVNKTTLLKTYQPNQQKGIVSGVKIGYARGRSYSSSAKWFFEPPTLQRSNAQNSTWFNLKMRHSIISFVKKRIILRQHPSECVHKMDSAH